jgi:hypothetical protein
MSLKRTAESFLSNQAGKGLSQVKNPILRSGLGTVLNNFLPGFGGGIPDFTDNSYAKIVDDRLAEIANQSNTVIATQENFQSTSDDKGDTLLRPLKETGGLVWQYTPNIFLSGTAEYNQALMQGMNYPINTFISSRAPDIPVAADFTASDIYEARYLLAIMTFLKICTKAYFGDTAVASGDFGTPPPVMLFEYLGDHGFNKVPVVVTNYSMQLADDVDYVPVVVNDQTTFVPSKTNITITLTPTYTPHKLRRRFDLNAVKTGRAYKDGFI